MKSKEDDFNSSYSSQGKRKKGFKELCKEVEIRFDEDLETEAKINKNQHFSIQSSHQNKAREKEIEGKLERVIPKLLKLRSS